MQRELKSTQRRVRTLFARVNTASSGTIVSGSTDFTLSRTGTGDVTLTTREVGARILAAVVTPIADAGDLAASLHTDTAFNKARVKLWDGTDGTTAKDGSFYLQMTVSDVADET